MKIPKQEFNPKVLIVMAEEKIKKLEEIISMHNGAIKNHTAEKEESISVLKYKVTDLQEMLLERDNYVKKLHNLRSEDVEVIDKLKEKLNYANDTLTTRSKNIDELRDRDAKTIRKLMDDKQNKQIDGTSDKVMRLKSQLNHSEQTNESLIAQIKSLSKFRNMYFKTAETLKLHLPN